MQLFTAKLPTRLIPPQPTVIITVGSFGQAMVEELKEREELYTRFQIAAGDWLRNQVRYVSLPYLDSSSAAEIRTNFLQAKVIEASQHIQEASRDSRQHARQPWTDFIRPRLIVLGATWEPAGCGLLWPIAALVRHLIGETMPYEFLGLFVAADYRASPISQDNGDAHTFALLAEGDQLLIGSPAPEWYCQLGELMLVTDQEKQKITRPLFDHVFLVDSLKQNNAMARAENNPTELLRMSATLLEALLFTPSYTLLDETLLEDFMPHKQQMYVSAGASALTVPLREIEEVLRQQTIAYLVQERLLKSLSKEAIGNLSKLADNTYELPTINRLSSIVTAEYDEGHLTPIGQMIRHLVKHGEEVPEYHYHLKYHIKFGQSGSMSWITRPWYVLMNLFGRKKDLTISNRIILNRFVPRIRRIQLSGNSPFSDSLSLDYYAVLDRLENEKKTIQIIIEKFKISLEEQATLQQVEAVFEEKYTSRLDKLLSAGEDTILQAIAILDRAINQWQNNYQLLKKESQKAEDNPELDLLRDAVEGGSRQFYYQESVLRPPLHFKPRPLSLLLRGVFLLALAYHFFWSGIIAGQDFPLLTYLWPYSFPAFLEHQNWEWLLLVNIVWPIFVGLGFLWAVPAGALNIALRFHRQGLAKLLKMELDRMLLNNAMRQAEMVVGFLTDLQRPLITLRDDLQYRTDQFKQNIGETLNQRDYLEYQVVTPADIISHEQLEEISRRAVHNHRGKVLASWLVSKDMAVGLIDLTSGAEIIQMIERKIASVTTNLVMKPVSDYLRRDDYIGWFQQLWQGSSPWIKTRNGQVVEETSPECNVLLATHEVESAFATTAVNELKQCHVVNGFDPYRILLLRLKGGISTDQLVRLVSMQRAFRQLPETIRQTITQEVAILSTFPSVLSMAEVHTSTSPSLAISIPATGSNTALVETLPANLEPVLDPASQTAYQVSLTDVIFTFEDAFRELYEAGSVSTQEYDGLEKSLQPLSSHVSSFTTPDYQGLEQALRPLDETYERLNQSTQDGLQEALAALEAFLNEQGIESVRPPVGIEYDPHQHGTAVGYTYDTQYIAGQIATILKRGYRQRMTGIWLREPQVMVSGDQPDGNNREDSE